MDIRTVRFLCVVLSLVVSGCQKEVELTGDWCSAVELTDRNWSPVAAPLSGVAGNNLDLTLRCALNTPPVAKVGERDVTDPAEWVVRVEVYDLNGQLQVPVGVGGSMDAPPFEVLGILYEQEADGTRGTVLWYSPDPPKTRNDGEAYYWTRLEAPQKPGEYEVVVCLYPTVVRIRANHFVDLGPGTELMRIPFIVSAGQVSTPRKEIYSLNYVDTSVPRSVILKACGIEPGQLLNDAAGR
ncbi:MAG: hypothetical protein R3C18_16700 [Planctomycetaceae bacterium]